MTGKLKINPSNMLAVAPRGHQHLMKSLFFLVISSCAVIPGKRGGKTTPMPGSLEFSYLSGRARVKYQEQNRRMSGIASLRIQRDSTAWLSLSPGLGIEAFRMLVTTDSVFLHNKITNDRNAFSFADLSEDYGIEVNFPLIQSLVTADMLHKAKPFSVKEEQNTRIFKGKEKNLTIEHHVRRDNNKVEKLLISDQKSGSRLVITYQDFQPVANLSCPREILLVYDRQGASTTSLEIRFSKIEIRDDALTFPFGTTTPGDRLDRLCTKDEQDQTATAATDQPWQAARSRKDINPGW